MITHASVFSGIGGPEVAATMLGWTNLFHCEINEFGRKILDYHYPEAESYEDITKTDFTKWRGKVNVLTGGFPCQPFSYAGKRGGAEDDRYLWPHMFRCIDEIRPDWVVAENVAGILTMVEQGEVSQMASAPWLTMFSDTNSEAPSPLNESAATSKPTDIPSSRYLFQLAVLEPRTEETECLLLPTPLVVEREHPDRVEALKATGATRINSRANGEQRPNGLIDFMQFYDMLPTPRANIVNDMDLNNEKLATRNKGNLEEAIAKAVCFLKTPCAADSYTDTMKSRGVSGTSGTLAQEIVNGYAEKHRGLMLPTPTATEGEKYTNTYNPNSQMGKSLSAMAGSSMLPTPVTQDYKKRGPNSQQQQLGELVYELANGSRDSKEAEKIVGVGQTSRLSPLFTEEMMGFPFLWTALPFLSASGEQNPSKPTATP